MTEREQFEAALAANPRWSLIGPLFSAPPAQQPQYEAADMASAAAQGFRAGVASVTQQPQEIEVVCPVCSHTFYAWPGEHKVQQPQAEPTDSMGIPLSCGKPLCSPGDHHPLCKLHKKPQAEAVKDFDAQLREVAKRAIPQQAEAVPPGFVVDRGFRWDGEKQQHIPQLTIEFEPVPANSPCDAQGWKDRDAVAQMFAAAQGEKP